MMHYLICMYVYLFQNIDMLNAGCSEAISRVANQNKHATHETELIPEFVFSKTVL